MNYNEYKIEDLTFLKETYKDWTTEEKKEFLDSCPENSGLPKTIEDLKGIKAAIESDEIKTNKWGEINKSSMKAYLKRNSTNIIYGVPYRKYWSSENNFYFNVDGAFAIIGGMLSIDNLIEKFDGGNIEERFKTLAEKYRQKEKDWSYKIETESYKATHKDQITANKILNAMLDAVRIELPTGVTIDSFGYTRTEKYDFRFFNIPHRTSQYGEITVNGVPFSEDKAKELTALVQEMTDKLLEVMNEYQGEIERRFK